MTPRNILVTSFFVHLSFSFFLSVLVGFWQNDSDFVAVTNSNIVFMAHC